MMYNRVVAFWTMRLRHFLSGNPLATPGRASQVDQTISGRYNVHICEAKTFEIAVRSGKWDTLLAAFYYKIRHHWAHFSGHEEQLLSSTLAFFAVNSIGIKSCIFVYLYLRSSKISGTFRSYMLTHMICISNKHARWVTIWIARVVVYVILFGHIWAITYLRLRCIPRLQKSNGFHPYQWAFRRLETVFFKKCLLYPDTSGVWAWLESTLDRSGCTWSSQKKPWFNWS